MTDISASIRKAKAESRRLASLTTETKDRALEAMAAALESRKDEVMEANARDIRENPDVQGALLKRLMLNDDKISAMVAGIRSVKGLADPVGHHIAEVHHAFGCIR